MAKTVTQAFDEFNKDVVNLDPDRTKVARKSRDWLFEQLNILQDKEDLNFPFKFEARHINFGSFDRKTKIRELDDIDLIFCFTADSATYTKTYSTYYINTSVAGARLQSLSDNSILNSKKVLNKLKLALSKIPQYKSADPHRVGEAVTLNLISYEWVYDIVPCFYTDTDLYLMPDRNGNWKATDPRVDQNRVSNVNQNKNGRLLQLIRTLKYWNRYHSATTMTSFLFENFVVNFANSKISLSEYVDYNVKDFFSYLQTAVYLTVADHKGLTADLNYLTFDQRVAISEKAQWAFNKAHEAILSENNKNNPAEAIRKWGEVFGPKFPVYE